MSLPRLGKQPLFVVPARFATTWRPGWTGLWGGTLVKEAVETGVKLYERSSDRPAAQVLWLSHEGQDYLLSASPETDQLRLQPLDQDGLPGSELLADLPPDFTRMITWSRGARTWVLLLSSEGRRLQVFPFDPQGVLGPLADERTGLPFTTGLALVETGDGPALFQVFDGPEGRYQLRRLGSDGRPGLVLLSGTLGRPVTHALTVPTSRGEAVLLYDSPTGACGLLELAANGTRSWLRAQPDLRVGLSTLTTWSSSGALRLFGISTLTGRWQIRSLDAEGTVADDVLERGKWSRGWSAAVAFSSPGGLRMFLHKESNALTRVYAIGRTSPAIHMLRPKDGSSQVRTIREGGWLPDEPEHAQEASSLLDSATVVVADGSNWRVRASSQGAGLHLDRIDHNGVTIGRRTVLRREPGWWLVAGAQVDGAGFVISHDPSRSLLRVDQVLDGQLRQTQAPVETPGALDACVPVEVTTGAGVNATTATWLQLHDASAGAVNRVELLADGTLGPPVRDPSPGSPGFSLVTAFATGGVRGVLRVAPATLDYELCSIGPEGELGLRFDSGDRLLEARYDRICSVTLDKDAGERAFVYLLHSDTGAGATHEIDASGTLLRRLDHQEPWTIADLEALISDGSSGALHKWVTEVSRGEASIEGTRITPWITLPESWEEFKEHSRYDKIVGALEAARVQGFPRPRGWSAVVMQSVPGDSGNSGASVLANPLPGSCSLEFLAHEVLHGWGLGHTFSDDPSIDDAHGKATDWGVYDDPWDIMSASSSIHYTHATLGVSAGPGANPFVLAQLGWLDDSAIIDLEQPASPQRHTLHSLSKPGNTHSLALRVHTAPGESTIAHLRTPEEWDEGFKDPVAHLAHVMAAERPEHPVDDIVVGEGWEVVQPYRVGSHGMVRFYRADRDTETIWRMKPCGAFDLPLRSTPVPPGMSLSTILQRGGRALGVRANPATRDAEVHELTEAGGSTLTWRGQLPTTATQLCGMLEGQDMWLVLADLELGTVQGLPMTNEGVPDTAASPQLSPRVEVGEGWTSAHIIQHLAGPMLLLFSSDSHALQIRSWSASRGFEEILHEEEWEEAAAVLAYGVRQSFVLGHSPSTEELRVRPVDGSGELKPLPKGALDEELPHWTHLQVLPTRAGLYLMQYRQDSGLAETRRLSRSRVLRVRSGTDPLRPQRTTLTGDPLCPDLAFGTIDAAAGTVEIEVG